MRWETVNITPEHEIYHLYRKEKQLLSLEINRFSNSARIQCNNEKRVFVIRKEGFRRNKTVIRNEYGIKLGEFGQENNEHFITVDEERFFFATRNTPLAELILYKDSREKPIVSCRLNVQEGDSGISFSKDKSLSGMPHPGLLMALYWYILLPVTKEESIAEYAEAL